MTIRAQLERNLRQRVAFGLEQSRTHLVDLIRRGIPEAAQASNGTDGEITGQLKAGIIVDPWSEQGSTYVTVVRSIATYSAWVEDGTGLFGPAGARITPKRGSVLAFYWYRIGEHVVVRSVAGMKPFHFFRAPMPERFREALEVGLSSASRL